MKEALFDKFEAYYYKRLSVDDTDEFEVMLSNNSKIQKDYEDYVISVLSVELDTVKEIKQKLSAVKRRKRLFFPTGKAATLAILVISVLGIYKSSQYSTKKLINDFTTPLEFNFIRGNGPTENTESHIYESLNNNNVSKALETIDQVQKTDANFQYLQDLKARILLDQKDYSQAYVIFDQVEQSRDPSFLHSAQWYKGICLLAIGDEASARALFSKISQTSNHDFEKEAAEILIKLNSFWRWKKKKMEY